MANSPANTVIEHLRKAVLLPDGGRLTDGQLLHRFLSARDQTAFEALVRRHGPMVLGVCRRLLGHIHDAEDAFQATFLILARKAASVVPPEAVGNWLYGVAYHTALKAQAAAARRRAMEKQVNVMPEPEARQEDLWQELLPLLDRELSRLPDKYRLPVVLCDLEGRSRREVSRQLAIPEGTLSSRLTTARRMLAQRLRRYGLVIAGGAWAALSANATAACVPSSLVVSTVEAATLFTAGEAAALTSVRAAALAEGVLKGMFLRKLEFATAFMLVACVLVLVAGGPAYHVLAGGGAGGEEPPERRSDGPPKNAPAATKDAHHGHAHGHGQERIQGSGKAVTREMDLKGFTAVEVSSVFRVEITRADSFRTAITADDNIFPYIQVTKAGSALRLSVDSKNRSISVTTLKASITMPALERVELARSSQATVKGFKGGKAFQAKLTGASHLNGEVEAGRVELEVTGGSKTTLKGAAKEARISATGAGSLSLGELTLDRADVTLASASSATVNVTKKLDYRLSGASRLEYRGNPAIGRAEVSGGSSASRIPADRRKTDARPALRFPHDEAAFRDHLREVHEHLHEFHANSPHLKGMHEFGPGRPTVVRPAEKAPSVRVDVGDKVPDFSLEDPDGKVRKFSELQKDVRRTKKGVVVLSFWCSFCPSCRRVEHRLEKLAKDYEGQALVMALDASAGETAERVRAAARKEGLTLPIVLDPEGHTADVFGAEATTTTVVIDGEGVLRYCGRFQEGQQAYAEEALKAVLAGKEVAVKTTRHDGCRILRK
jgi:RNA polymerase sigma factor (sigma-70 family)